MLDNGCNRVEAGSPEYQAKIEQGLSHFKTWLEYNLYAR